jgi:hypothetical protein
MNRVGTITRDDKRIIVNDLLKEVSTLVQVFVAT